MTGPASGEVLPAPDALVAATLADRFGELVGCLPAGVWAAPGRVNLVGEHLDYNGGRCLPFALPHRTYAAVAPRSDGVVTVRSIQRPGELWSGLAAEVGPGRVQGWAAYVVGVWWALREEGFDVPGADIVVDGRVPLGAGLSSSAALECAVAVAVDELAGLGLGGSDAGRARLAAACTRAENEIAGAPTGGLDQTASLRSRAGHALLVDGVAFTTELVPFDPAAGVDVLVIDTRARHQLVDGQYARRREACEQAARLLGVRLLATVDPAELDQVLERIDREVPDPSRAAELRRRTRHVLTESARVGTTVSLLRAGSLADIGPVLSASHASLRDDFEVSCGELDLACAAAEAAGALGARLVGGGFGGSAIALVPTGGRGVVIEGVTRAFADAGHRRPGFLLATPSSSAGRVSPSP